MCAGSRSKSGVNASNSRDHDASQRSLKLTILPLHLRIVIQLLCDLRIEGGPLTCPGLACMGRMWDEACTAEGRIADICTSTACRLKEVEGSLSCSLMQVSVQLADLITS